ncbi:RIP homotypic interaction motif-containing protein [Cupriavidus pinatubonensis]|uniref:Uncharacterized protein n=1 Tax=Cupriavidus pinatubonensis TaxID=248026 RepID=A0ABN7ZFU5_9BURK|nr:RIP homotypic interaction motif-containing protein [Cupriavidus pinatubonensis]CAG9183870.1 hypothetical protein LMG23994_05250 [Cupriavidus pinatubonensis]
MNAFANLLKDQITVKSKDGEQSATYKTSINASGSGHVATVFDETFIGTEGSILLRTLPGGREEAYLIQQADFSPGLSGIPPHWNLKLKKGTSLGQQQQEAQTRHAPIININNSQGIQIGDQNVQHIASSLQGLIEKIDQSSASPSEKNEAKGLVAKVLENPTVASLLGGVIGGAVELLK